MVGKYADAVAVRLGRLCRAARACDTNYAEVEIESIMKLSYRDYEDKILGGWIGKSIGGTLGAEHEGVRTWIDLETKDIIPEKLPPNDDLDLQILWLKVLEEKGPMLRGEDLADAWLEGCWYPFNEYGNFRRNYRHGIRPPYTGMHDNDFFESGMGCPIRSEIWGYVLPGAPDVAAGFAWIDGTLDHTDESVCPEQMFSAMAADGFFIQDIRRLIEKHIHYLKPELTVTRLVYAALEAYDQGLTLREARERVLLLGGNPEACDAQVNVPFTVLAMLYGEGDLEKTILAALRCGFDTDCTLATAGAFIGQMLGARGIPKKMRDIVGDELVMGIEYRRKEMTLSALARDTAMVGLKMADALQTGIDFSAAPKFKPYSRKVLEGQARMVVDYPEGASAAPGDTLTVTLAVENASGADGANVLEIKTPTGWTASPRRAELEVVGGESRDVHVMLSADERVKNWPSGHGFEASLARQGKKVLSESFGLGGATLWRMLGVFYDPCDMEGCHEPVTLETIREKGKSMRQHFAGFDRNYIDEARVAKDRIEGDALFEWMSGILGKPAVLMCRDSFIDPADLIQLHGPWVCYLDGQFRSPVARDAFFWVGSNDGYRFWMNGETAAERNVQRWWTPNSDQVKVKVRKGVNRIVLKLLKRGDQVRFSMGLREQTPSKEFPRKNDWVTDLVWKNPLG